MCDAILRNCMQEKNYRLQGFVVYSNEARRSRFAQEFRLHSDHLSHDLYNKSNTWKILLVVVETFYVHTQII